MEVHFAYSALEEFIAQGQEDRLRSGPQGADQSGKRLMFRT